jgi:hypothetical protein
MSMDYLKLLTESYESDRFCGKPGSRLEYLSDYIFDFTTYEDEAAELFARKAVEVAAEINNGTTFDYIKRHEDRIWFLLMVNMPFFYPRLEWGTSIRGAWWQHDNHELDSCGLFDGETQLGRLTFTRDEWREFIAAVVEFAALHAKQEGQPAPDVAGSTRPDGPSFPAEPPKHGPGSGERPQGGIPVQDGG